MSVVRTIVCTALLALPALAGAQPPQPAQPPPAQTEFVPLSEVPPTEQIPAFTLLAAAYAFVWLALLGYVWSVSQRLQQVERELATIERRST
jgi:CcmD family protein